MAILINKNKGVFKMNELINENDEANTCEVLGDVTIDNCDIALDLAESAWAKDFWATTRARLLRKMQDVTSI